MLKIVDKVDVNRFSYKDTEANICYTNDTRVYINKMWNDKLKTKDAILISANSDDFESQDMYLYERSPVIATRTKRDEQADIYGRIVKNIGLVDMMIRTLFFGLKYQMKMEKKKIMLLMLRLMNSKITSI